jgi:hypothetical protein
MRSLLRTLTAAAVVLGATSVSATTITLVVTGKLTVVDDSNDVSDGSLTVGADYTATLVYDLAAAFDRDPDPAYGDWVVPAAASSVTVIVGSYAFDAADPLVFGFEDGFILPNLDTSGWLVLGLSGVGVLDPGVTWGAGYTAGSLFDYTGTAVTSDVLANANWKRSAYGPDDLAFELVIEVFDPRTTGPDSIQLFGTIDSITVLTPEPSMLALLAASLLPMLKRALR